MRHFNISYTLYYNWRHHRTGHLYQGRYKSLWGMNQREIGELMGIDYSALSVMRKKLSVLQKKDQNLSAEIEKIKKRLH